MADTNLEHAFQWVANSKGLFDYWAGPDDIHPRQSPTEIQPRGLNRVVETCLYWEAFGTLGTSSWVLYKTKQEIDG
jgi:hypothetical protein